MTQKRENLLSKDYILVMISAMGTSFINYFFFAVIPPYMDILKRSSFDAGVMTAIYALAALVSRPVAGMLSDRFGRVKLLIAGAFLCALTCASLSVTTVFWLMIVIRAVGGFGFGIHSTCSGAVVADIVPKSRLAEGIGFYGLASILGQMAAPSLALVIIAGNTMRDFKALFFTAMGLALMSVVSGCGLTYERKRKKAGLSLTGSERESVQTERADVPAAPLPKTLFGFEYAVFAPFAVMIMLFTGLTSIMVFVTKFAAEKGFGNSGLFFACGALGVFLARVILRKVIDKRGADVVIIPGTAAIAVLIAALSFTGSELWFLVLAVPIGMAQGAVMPAFNSMMFRRCSVARRGTAAGAYFAAIDIGFVGGSLMLGAIGGTLNFKYAYWAAAISVALALVIYVLIASDKRHNRRQERLRERGVTF